MGRDGLGGLAVVGDGLALGDALVGDWVAFAALGLAPVGVGDALFGDWLDLVALGLALVGVGDAPRFPWRRGDLHRLNGNPPR
eukprot:4780129-Pyramimonas_sp.AAC.1